MANYHVQWTGQYYIAYELSRRGYVATLTVGNAPELDILARSPKGTSFSVEVKSMRKNNTWRFGKPTQNTDFWFFVALNSDDPEVSIMTGEEVLKEWQDYFQKSCAKNPECIVKHPENSNSWGLPQGAVKKYIKRWDILPK